MAENEEKGVEVTIIDRREIVTYPRLREPVETVAVTFIAPGMPPKTIFIPKSEYSKEKELELIRKEVTEYMKFKPETVRV
mgnify:CR=1 FL=1